MTEWRGPDALNNDDLATSFWDQVADHATPGDYTVGKAVLLEITHDGEVLARKMIRITEVVQDAKGRHVQFRDVAPGEAYADSGLVLVVPQ